MSISILVSIILILILISISIMLANTDILDVNTLPFFNEYINRIKHEPKDDLIGYVNNPGEISKVVHRINIPAIAGKGDYGRSLSTSPSEITMRNLPGWIERVYREKEILEILNQTFGPNHKITQAYNLISPEYPVIKSDFFRCIITYLYGGLYLDLKGYVDGILPDIPEDKDIYLSQWTQLWSPPYHSYLLKGGEIINWYIYARAGTSLLSDTINVIADNIIRISENPGLIHQYTFPKEPSPKNMIISISGPIALTATYLASDNIDRCLIDPSINDIIQYCHPSCSKINKRHYSCSKGPLITFKSDNYIPKDVYMTYHKIDKIPKYVMDNIYKYCKGYNIHIYDDPMCEKFLLDTYGKRYVEVFRKLKGAHKADFWRYCILYIRGGYYFDIKTNFQVPIDQIYDSTKQDTWYTVIDQSCIAIYNGIIVTYPANPIILKAINHIVNHHPPVYYYCYIRKLYNLIKQDIGVNPQVGENTLTDGSKLILLQENCVDGVDKYGLKCVIKDEKDDLKYITRYDDFPWK
jgi:mannosyltransferase OCH1-like enzyme